MSHNQLYSDEITKKIIDELLRYYYYCCEKMETFYDGMCGGNHNI